MTPIIEFKNYTFKYRSQSEPTLREIDLTVNPGEKVLIVGPSGSGKSTLVHCINGMVPFSYPGESSGTLTVGGKDPAKTGIFGMSKIVGTVLQDTDGQFIGLTVAEDVAFALVRVAFVGCFLLTAAFAVWLVEGMNSTAIRKQSSILVKKCFFFIASVLL